jgi:ribonuclease HI
MELQAAIESLRSLKQPCEIEFFTDSEYVKNGISKWIASWRARGWRTVNKQPVKNEDLWRALDAAVAPHRIHWKWLKGHAGHVDNERCDQLAGAAIAKIRQDFKPEQIRAALEEFKARSVVDSQTLL